MDAMVKPWHDDRVSVHSRSFPRLSPTRGFLAMRERGADKAPRSVSYAALRQRPARPLRNPARPLFYLRRLAPTKSQRCNIPQGLAPWVDPFGLAATKSL